MLATVGCSDSELLLPDSACAIFLSLSGYSLSLARVPHRGEHPAAARRGQRLEHLHPQVSSRLRRKVATHRGPLRQCDAVIIGRDRRPQRAFGPIDGEKRVGRAKLHQAAVLAHSVREPSVLVPQVEREPGFVARVGERPVRREAIEENKASKGHLARHRLARELGLELGLINDQVARRLVMLEHVPLVAARRHHLHLAIAERRRRVAERQPHAEHERVHRVAEQVACVLRRTTRISSVAVDSTIGRC